MIIKRGDAEPILTFIKEGEGLKEAEGIVNELLKEKDEKKEKDKKEKDAEL